MAEHEVVAANPREGKFNKNAARRVRVAGKIPAVVYGAKEPSMAVELDPKQITRILHSESGHNTIFDLEIGSGKTKAMIVDWQYEPIKGKLMHIDLKRIAMDKAMRVKVPYCWRVFRSASRCRAASSIRCCAKWRSSACRATSRATST